MRQQVMIKPKEIVFRDIPIPTPAKNEVLVKIFRIGVCGSDIHVYHGTHPFTNYPVTQGHEVSGEIVELGSEVKGLRIGQKVTIEPQVTCGTCYPCRHGKYNLCENLKVMGFQTTGTASEYFAVNTKNVTPIPDEMSFDEGAMIEPLAVGIHAANKAGEIAGKNVVVIGAGPIGNLVAQSVKAKGAKAVLISDISDLRLEIARDCGCDFTVNTRNSDLGEKIAECFGADKADIIYDCAGNDITIGQAIRYARKGSQIILVAVFVDMANVDLAVLNDHELDLNTSMMYRHTDYLEAIQLVSEGKINLKRLITKHFPFARYHEAYEYIDANRESTMKALIDVHDECVLN